MMSKSLPTIIDRAVHQVIPNSLIQHKRKHSSHPDTADTADTDTDPANASLETYFLHKIHGTSVLFQTTKLLRLSPSVYATSTTIFHRFYHRDGCTLQKYDVWSVCLGSVLLACKVEEEARRIREIILVFLHVYRRMRLGVDAHVDLGMRSEEGDSKSLQLPIIISTAHSDILKEKKLTRDEKLNVLRYIRPLPQYGTLYQEWQETIMEMENIILREMGFTLYWIPGTHPHVFLLYFMKVLEIPVDVKRVAQRAWNYCNDSCRIDLCVRYLPEMTACAAIHLACFQDEHGDDGDNDECTSNISLPLSPTPWWHAFVGSGRDDDLSIICNALLALGDDGCINGYMDATNRYVVSMVEGGSICDPGSFSWNAMD
jgi:hypothetical protein